MCSGMFKRMKIKLNVNIKKKKQKDGKLRGFMKFIKLESYTPKLENVKCKFDDLISAFDDNNIQILEVIESIVDVDDDFSILRNAVFEYKNKKYPKKTPKTIIEDVSEIERHRRILVKFLSVFESCGVLKHFYIPFDDIILNERFSSGAFGIIQKVSHKGKTFAAKKMFVKKVDDLIAFAKETKLLSVCNHKNIIDFIGFSIDTNTDSVFIITELCETDDLYSLLHNKSIKVTTIEKISIIRDVHSALLYLHDTLEMAHRDIKSKNIILSSDKKNDGIRWIAKLCDFGSGGFKKEISNSLKGSPHNMPPEILMTSPIDLDGFKKVNHELLDIYAFGNLMYEIWTEITPYEDFKHKMNKFVILRKVCSGELRLDYKKLKHVTPSFKRLIKSCCDHDKNKRPQKFRYIKNMIQEMELTSTI